jgi:lipopolysaccharide transport system permease protein
MIASELPTRINASFVRHSSSPLALLDSAWSNRHIILQLSRRDIAGRYRGSILGLFWSLFHPLLMLGVYTFVFSVVFKTRWTSGDPTSRLDFALILFAGLIMYAVFAECVNRAPGAILAYPNFVKKVVFPLEVMPWVLLASALFHAVVSLSVLLAAYFLMNWHLHWTVVLLPLVMLPLITLCLGVAWFLSSLGVFVRDVGQATGVITSALMFLSPLFFPSSALPENYRIFMQLNPMTFPIEQAREVLLWGNLPDWMGLVVYSTGSFVVMWLGFVWFQRTRKGFADVI